jgi:hypothetical protein
LSIGRSFIAARRRETGTAVQPATRPAFARPAALGVTARASTSAVAGRKGHEAADAIRRRRRRIAPVDGRRRGSYGDTR